jgi:hypothetical protein
MEEIKLVVPESKTPEILLPTARKGVIATSPRKLLLYSPPKAGKTTLVAGLDNCLVLDLEQGSGFVDAMRYSCKTTTDIFNFCEAVKAQGKKYSYLAIDTVTALETMCIPLAKSIYMNTPQGKNFKGDNVLHLPDGGGYIFLRNAVDMMIAMLESTCDRIILLGHLKDKFLGAKAGVDVSAKDIDLIGKIKNIACANSDAIGYLYRKDNNTIVSFITSDEVLCGARPAHLKNQEIVVAIQQPDGTIKTFWNKIYID